MKIYQVLKRSFFTGSNGCDYAMAIDSKDDILLFTDYIDAKNKFYEIVTQLVEMWWNNNGGKSNKPLNSVENDKELYTVIYHDKEERSRTYVSLEIRKTL